MSSGERTKARYIMIGGFLGAGKTTAVGKLASQLKSKGYRVGLITNDQGQNLVDTAMLRSQGFATEEIPGGCFCCRFNSLVEAADRLTESTQPEIIIAEPVGSCTDLAATVTYPLRRMYKDNFTIAPISVLVDTVRARRVFGLEAGNSFSEKVIYIYRKQLEEADILILSKSDLLTAQAMDELEAAIGKEYPNKKIQRVSSRTGENMEEWFSQMMDENQTARTAMEVDYEIYADGEALLGWLNCTVNIVSEEGLDSEKYLQRFAGEIQQYLNRKDMEVAHLKMTLSPDDSISGEIAGINLVRNDYIPELSYELDAPVTRGQLIINLRAEGAPEVLAEAVKEALQKVSREFAGLQGTMDHLEHFRPGKPTPTHRVTNLAD